MTSATPTLLYIDDDAALGRLVDRGLTRLGFKVVHAADGQQGLDRLAQGGIDAVALDQYMPGLDGLETLEKILAIPMPRRGVVTASRGRGSPHCAPARCGITWSGCGAISFHCFRSPLPARCGRRKFKKPATR
jgi:CheY-like chemotaxis protein